MTDTVAMLERLTAKEMAFKARIATRDGLQRATLGAALRTGKRIGVSVGQAEDCAPQNPQGKPFNVDLCAFRLNNRTGEPTGSAKVTTLATGLSESEVIAFLNQWNG